MNINKSSKHTEEIIYKLICIAYGFNGAKDGALESVSKILDDHNKELLCNYTKFLADYGYIDDDWWQEPKETCCIDRFFNEYIKK